MSTHVDTDRSPDAAGPVTPAGVTGPCASASDYSAALVEPVPSSGSATVSTTGTSSAGDPPSVAASSGASSALASSTGASAAVVSSAVVSAVVVSSTGASATGAAAAAP